MDMQDEELLARYRRRGDVAALEAMIERYRRPLFGFILNMTGSPNEAQDVFQETWLRAIRRLGLYREGNFRGWLMRITASSLDSRQSEFPPDDNENSGIMESISETQTPPQNRSFSWTQTNRQGNC